MRAAVLSMRKNSPTSNSGNRIKAAVEMTPQTNAANTETRKAERTLSVLPVPEIVTDNRLGRLGNGVTYHEDEREIITAYSESTYSVISQMAHEYLVADEQQYRHCQFA